MATLQKLQKLSESHCVLLAVQYATQANVPALRALTALQEAHFPLELVLRILLTYLPEESAPPLYLEFLNELATNSRTAGDNPATSLDLTSVEDLSNARAKKRRQALDLLPTVYPLYAAESDIDTFSHFLLHRAHRIDSQTGLLDSLSQLIVPFLGYSDYLRTWFISTALPLLRLSYEYYPQKPAPSLDEFARWKGKRAIEYQLSNAGHTSGGEANNIARDLKCVVSPWICGATDRKRRRLTSEAPTAAGALNESHEQDDWDGLFQWLLHKSKDDLALASAAFKGWDGPEDMDLGGYEEGRDYVGDEEQRALELKYVQTALACIILVEKSDLESLNTAHALLQRVCELLSLDAPQDLEIAATSLPSYVSNDFELQNSGLSSLREERLLEPDNIVTKPGQESIYFLDLIILSAFIFSNLQHPLSIRDVAGISLSKRPFGTACPAPKDSSSAV